MKKLLFLLFSVMLSTQASMADDVGKCGPDLTWTYTESNKTLTIEGTGAMYNYSTGYSDKNSPWCYYDNIDKILIGPGVTTIGEYAFCWLKNVSYVYIPNSVISIGDYAFDGCSDLSSIAIPNSVMSIGNYAFYYCSGLTSVTMSNSLTSIGNSAFQGCSSLTSITIPKSVTSIGYSAFNGCSGLTSIIFDNGITRIDYWAFSGCTTLSDVYCYAEQLPTTESSAFESANIDNATLHVPASVLFLYQTFSPWKDFGKIVALTDSDPKPTGIKMIHVTGFKANDYYDLNGVRQPEAKKGINIINGKKVIAK